jgi:Zn-dependent membrane protease YugP
MIPFGFDPIALAIGLVGMGLAMAASFYVKVRFNRGKSVELRSRMTGAEIAEAILAHERITDVRVVPHQGFLSDHYNPGSKTLALSPDVYYGTHAAAAGVAAHEVGHALQHARKDLTMWGRTLLVYPAHFGSMLAPLLIMAGFGLSMFTGGQGLVEGSLAWYLAMAGLVGFGVAALCGTVIVFNEFNASARARTALVDMRIIRPGSEEEDTVKGVLTAAGLTYVASAATALMYLLYYAWLIFGNRRQE